MKISLKKQVTYWICATFLLFIGFISLNIFSGRDMSINNISMISVIIAVTIVSLAITFAIRFFKVKSDVPDTFIERLKKSPKVAERLVERGQPNDDTEFLALLEELLAEHDQINELSNINYEHERSKRERLEMLTKSFHSEISTIFQQMFSLNKQLILQVDDLTGLSHNAMERARKSTDHMLQTQSSIQTVAEHNKFALEVLSEVNATMSAVRDISGFSINAAETARDGVQELKDNAKDVGKIVTKIGTIASQTNLLALNAAIEALSSGDNKSGFAVVAQEVKLLAKRAGDSASDIKTHVVTMSEKTYDTQQSIQNIAQQVTDMMDIAVSLNDSLKQQNINQAALDTSLENYVKDLEEAQLNTTQLVNLVDKNSSATVNIKQAMTDLNNSINHLHGKFQSFLEDWGADQEDRRRHARRAVNRIVDIEINCRNYPIKMMDISESGARLASLKHMTKKSKILIHGVSNDTIEAKLVWKSNDFTGVQFENPISDAEINSFMNKSKVITH